MKNQTTERVFKHFTKLFDSIKNANWKNPRNILLAVSFLILPFVAGHYLYTGLILGLIMSVSVLWLLEKAPNSIKNLIIKYPLASDLILSSFAVMVIGGYFGSGLTLGLGAAFATVILSWALPVFGDLHQHETTA